MRAVSTTRVVLSITCTGCSVLVAGGLFSFAGELAATPSAAASELWDRYQEEAPRIAARLEQATLRLKYRTGTQSSRSANAGGPAAAQDGAPSSELTLRPGFMKKIGLDPRGIETVMSLNDAYAFEITKSPQRDQYAIRWLEPRGGWLAVGSVIDTQRGEALAEGFGYWYLYGIPFFELAANESCRVTAVATELKEERKYLRVEFEKFREGRTPSTNYALLDPEQGWAPVETGSTYAVNKDHPEWKAEYVASIEFGEPIDGLPISKQKTESWTSKDWLRNGPDIIQTRVTTVEVMETEDISPDEFYLSHFGLPEPHFERSWYGSWLIYLVAGAACLAAAYAIRRRRRQAV